MEAEGKCYGEIILKLVEYRAFRARITFMWTQVHLETLC